MKNFFLVIVSLLLALVIFEGGLQIYSKILDKQREAILDEKSDIRILAIGESTTDKLMAPQGKPWTHFLQEKIQQDFPEYKVTVINKGKSGLATAFIMRDVHTWIKEYKPHLIISMIGVNDWTGFSFIHDEDFFSRLRTVRLLRWWWKTIFTVDKKEIKIQYPNLKEIQELDEILTAFFIVGRVAPEIGGWIKNNPGLEWYALKSMAMIEEEAIFNSTFLLNNREVNKHAAELFERALELNPMDNQLAVGILYHGWAYGDEYRKRVVKSLVNAKKRNLQPDEKVLKAMAFRNFLEDPEIKKFFSQNISTKNNRAIDQLKSNYLFLGDTTIAKSIDLAVMAYPTTHSEMYQLFFDLDYKFPRETLSENFYIPHPDARIAKKYAEIIFIDNSSFPKKYDLTYYTDFHFVTQTAGFGHTTRKGHELIAENAYQTLKKDWFPKIRARLTKKP